MGNANNLTVDSKIDGAESDPARASADVLANPEFANDGTTTGPSAGVGAGGDGADVDGGGGGGGGGGSSDVVARGLSTEELIYGASSFHAIVKPVSATMVLASLAVNYVNTEATKASGEAALDQSYQVFTLSDDQSAATNLGLGLVNALVIVACITGMTFLIVLLYKYRCVSFFPRSLHIIARANFARGSLVIFIHGSSMYTFTNPFSFIQMKLLIGYMMFASAMLLGFLGGLMFTVLIDKYQLAIDQVSFILQCTTLPSWASSRYFTRGAYRPTSTSHT